MAQRGVGQRLGREVQSQLERFQTTSAKGVPGGSMRTVPAASGLGGHWDRSVRRASSMRHLRDGAKVRRSLARIACAGVEVVPRPAVGVQIPAVQRGVERVHLWPAERWTRCPTRSSCSGRSPTRGWCARRRCCPAAPPDAARTRTVPPCA